MTKVSFHTLGCKVNQYETEAMKEKFLKAGYEVMPEGSPADIYIINTCTVTNLADRKSRQFIRRAKKLNPESFVVATGCYVQVKPEEAAAIEGVDMIVGVNEKAKIFEYIESELGSRGKSGRDEGSEIDGAAEGVREARAAKHVLSYEDLSEYRSDGIISAVEGKSRAFIKIEEGCNRFCSYCIIPFARGKVRSRAPEEVVEEAKQLIAAGFKEIVLTGINTALYGTDLGMGGIEPLIGMLDSLKGDFRIRLSSLEPTVINKEYVKSLLKYEKLCHHLHLSLQSGSDKVLAAMNRRYDRKDFLEIVQVLREFDPYYGITSDIIAGFPGEDEEDFNDSLSMIREAGIDRVHSFKYSKREGTVAASMANQVPDKVKQERGRVLQEVGEEVSLKRREMMKEIVRQVLLEELVLKEGSSGGRKSFAAGYSDNYIRVYVAGGEELIGRVVDVRFGDIMEDGVEGII